MSSRKPGYVISVILLAVLLAAPQLLAATLLTVNYFLYQTRPLRPIPGVGPTEYHATLPQLQFWRDKFVHYGDLTPNARRIALIDPESGHTEMLEPTLAGSGWPLAFIFGNRIWFVLNNETFELIDNVLLKSNLAMPAQYPVDNEQFLWEGQPSFVMRISNALTVSTLQGNAWKPTGTLSIPDRNRDYQFNGTSIRLTRQSEIQVCNSTVGLHLFARNGGLLFHRSGLEIAPLPMSSVVNENKPIDPLEGSEQANSTVNAEDHLADWSLIREKPAHSPIGLPVTYGVLVDGRPVAVIIDEIKSGNAIGRLYRLEGTTWSEFASMTFPFGSTSFAAVTTEDGQRSYLGVSTTYGQYFVYAIEATGFRTTQGSAIGKIYGPQASSMNYVSSILSSYINIPTFALALGSVLGASVWGLMRRFTKPEYEFGMQTVRLASLGRRGFARLIDLSLIALTTVGFGWLMMQDFDWLAFAEALNLHVDHPTKLIASRVATILAAWLVVIVFLFLIAQAIWGITPGKWLCRLKTVRTSLRPCGFARSLAREIVFFVDCCNFVCWVPGILSIAFTEKRQRLGDLVADTIVVESASLTPASKD